MTTALIGHTGFVGGTLMRQTSFDDFYNSKNIGDIAGKQYSLIVCAGAPAVKWKANKEPDEDWAGLQRLMEPLGRAQAEHVVLISTVDVYDPPIDVDEDTSIDRTAGHAYGRHRLLLEDFVSERFETTVLRLPGLFGQGLKKNIIYDLLNDNMLDAVCPQSAFQFYSLTRLWSDIERVREAGLSLMNVATEPVTVAAVAKEAFGLDFENPKALKPARYDMKTKNAAVLGGKGEYIQTAAEVLSDMAAFVEQQRSQGQ